MCKLEELGATIGKLELGLGLQFSYLLYLVGKLIQNWFWPFSRC